MSKRIITAKGGPLHGRRFTVAPTTTEFPSPLASQPGVYKVTAKQAAFHPAAARDAGPDDEAA